MTTIAFLGTGTMGAPMARNLLTAGFEVRVWNRTRSKAEHLATDGATVTDSPEQAARGADVLITMLLDGPSTVAAGRSAIPALAEGAVWLQMGTIGLAGMDEVLAAAGDVQVVDAPVLGTKTPAEKGTLIVLSAGAVATRDRVQPLLDAVGERTMWVGDDAGRTAGTRLKLAANSWVLALTNAVAESVALAEALEVSPQDFLDAIKGTATDSPYAHLKGAAMINRDFTPSFTLSAARKDAALIDEAAEGVQLDLADAVRERFRRAEAHGHGDEDMAAAYFASFPDE